jgi:hypothetical protein
MKRNALPIGILAAALLGCPRPNSGPSDTEIAEARRELITRGRTDQEVRTGVFGPGGVVDSASAQRMMHTDSSNTTWLKAYVAKWGWPRVRVVGREAVEAAFFIVQHAVHDTAFQRQMLPEVTSAAQRGDLDAQSVALLTDRIQTQAGRPQTYGTQASIRNGRLVFDSIDDSANVDDRRRTVGLPPLMVYKRLLDSMYNISSPRRGKESTESATKTRRPR